MAEITRVLKLEGEAIFQCVERLNQKPARLQMEKAIEYLQNSLKAGGKVIVTGIGKSGKIGQKIAATFCSTGSFAVYLHPSEGLHGDIGMVRSQDVILAISYTGNTEEILRILPFLRSFNVPIIGMGGNPHSKLAQSSDAWIDAYVENEACPHNLAPTTSTTLALAIGDALALALMQLKGFGAKDFAQNHPGGSLGRRLTLKVGDLMQKGDRIPQVGPLSSIEEVVIVSTQKKLGAVLVMQGEGLLGIITDGDLRRSLQKKEGFFQLKAQDVMTSNPVFASPEMMAQEALELMENRSSQISVLPVLDQHRQVKGLIRLHDIVNTF